MRNIGIGMIANGRIVVPAMRVFRAHHSLVVMMRHHRKNSQIAYSRCDK
jgi:hypothetical protein